MDYRERKYYLISVRYYNDFTKKAKRLVPSMKIHRPYNHYREKIIKNTKPVMRVLNQDKYSIVNQDNIRFINILTHIQVMISCKFKDCEAFENLMKSQLSEFPNDTVFKEITKEDCWQ